MNDIIISIPSLTENIRIVESFIDNAKEKLELNDDIYGNIMIAITESVNNAIIHGNAADKTKNVELRCKMEDNVVVFYVTDEGEGFDYNSLPDPTSPDNIDKPGGRGIFLMKALCDELQFQENGRKVKLSFYVD
jgi:serine/threonine-protein kinase RsbW